MFTFKPKYALLALVLFIIEILIALYVDDSIIRPYGGDFLVVILIYCFVRAFVAAPVNTIAIAVLLFSYVIEFLQKIGFVKLIGMGKSRLANVVLGNSFAWTDILAYTLGILFVLLIERSLKNKKRNTLKTWSASVK